MKISSCLLRVKRSKKVDKVVDLTACECQNCFNKLENFEKEITKSLLKEEIIHVDES